MKASDLFLKCLEAQNVQIIFGVPGEENADVLISLKNSPIQFITCRHEQSAAFMADMYGRLLEKPGVCLSTLGPGATNLITGVANANIDNVPLVAIVGQASTTRLHKESHQNMNAVEMYKPVTKWSTSILEETVIPEIIYKAFYLTQIGRPGAVMIELPEDIAVREVNLFPLPRIKQEIYQGLPAVEIEDALKLIAHSRSPLILIGSGAANENCEKVIAKFIAYTKIYAAVTFMGKGAISTKNPFSLHCVGLGMQDLALAAFAHADLVICIGYRMVEWHPDHWNIGIPKSIIHIDVSPPEVDKNYLPQVNLIGHIPNILKVINKHLEPKHQKDPKLFEKLRHRITEDLRINTTSNSFPIKPQRMLHDLRKVMADRDILISDVGAHKMWVARQYPTYHTKTCFIYNGFCSMGGAIPGAVVAKMLFPEKNVVALCGDGGFIMSIQALVTAVEYKLPIVILVWQDDCYGLIKWKQELTYHTHSYVDLYNPNLSEVGRAFGCHSKKIDSADELIPTIKEAFAAKDKPTVIVIPIDYSENIKLTERLGQIVSH